MMSELGESPLKIVAIGSSATRGYEIKQEDAWPEQLEQVCHQAGWNVTVSNKATHGLPLPGFAERIVYLERTDPQDLYLLQLSVADRLYLGVNGRQRLKEASYSKDVILGWSEKNFFTSPTRVLLSGVALDENSPFHQYLNFFFMVIKRNNPKATFEEFLTYLKFWEANIRDSDLELINYVKEIVLLQQLLLALRKPYIMFQWNGFCIKQVATRTEPFYSLIDWSVFIGNGDVTAIEYLQRSYPDLYKEIQNDAYHHLNRAGNRLIAETLVFPSILKWRSVPK